MASGAGDDDTFDDEVRAAPGDAAEPAAGKEVLPEDHGVLAASAAYGPNGAAVEALLDALQHLDVPQLMSLASAGMARPGDAEADADVADREALRAELREIAIEADLMAAIRRVNDEIEGWATSVHHWNPAGVIGSSQSRVELDMRMATVRVVLDAAYATVLAEELDEDEVELLTRPWRDVTADPEGTLVEDPDAGPFDDEAQDEDDDADETDEDDDADETEDAVERDADEIAVPADEAGDDQDDAPSDGASPETRTGREPDGPAGDDDPAPA